MSLWEYYLNIDWEELKRNKNTMLYVAAQIDENNVVLQTIAVDQSDITDSDGNITDAKTTEWANYITKSNGNWLYSGMKADDNNTRGIQPGPGDLWHPTKQQFYPYKRFDSWTLNEETLQWEAPIPRPADHSETNYYKWDEENQTWRVN
jgi:hypothetical protein